MGGEGRGRAYANGVRRGRGNNDRSIRSEIKRSTRYTRNRIKKDINGNGRSRRGIGRGGNSGFGEGRGRAYAKGFRNGRDNDCYYCDESDEYETEDTMDAPEEKAHKDKAHKEKAHKEEKAHKKDDSTDVASS